VCGWVYAVSKEEERRDFADLNRVILQVIFWGAAIVIGFLFLGFLASQFTRENEKLADKYNIKQDQVVIQPKPHGCDFDDAPLGNKHCHYEEVVDVGRVCDDPKCQVTGVHVSWRKVEE
jgi:hypothetical protein